MSTFLRTGAVAMLCVLSAATLFAADRKFEKKFTVTSGGTFTISTDAGSVSVEGTGGSEVSILAEMQGRERDVNDFEITATQTGSGVEVTGRARRGGWFGGSMNLDIRFTVKVPHDYNLHLNTSGGDINAATLKGDVKGETSGGNIDVKDVQGAIGLNTSGGSIHVEKVNGSINMETSGGDITIATVTGNIDVSTSGGNIRINDVDGKVRAETSGGDVQVKVRSSNKGVFAETSGGNIDIVVAKDVAATIDASTSGGAVVCDLPVTVSGRIEESRVHGTINGGGNTIHAHTSGGDVRIRANE